MLMLLKLQERSKKPVASVIKIIIDSVIDLILTSIIDSTVEFHDHGTPVDLLDKRR